METIYSLSFSASLSVFCALSASALALSSSFHENHHQGTQKLLQPENARTELILGNFTADKLRNWHQKTEENDS